MYDELVKRLRNCATQVAPCKTCDMTEDGSCSNTLMKQAADAIEELSRAQEQWIEQERNALLKSIPRWIPVTERLPEHGWYLAYGPTIKMEVLHFHSVEEVWSSERYYGIEVTHWMPLPEPPKEET